MPEGSHRFNPPARMPDAPPPDTLEELQLQIRWHEARDDNRGLLDKGITNLINRGDENSLAKLKELEERAKAGQLQKGEIEAAVKADREALKWQDEVSHYGTGVIKAATLFLPGGRGRLKYLPVFVAGGVHMVDQVRMSKNDDPADIFMDATMGFAKGAGLKYTLDKVSHTSWKTWEKGAVIGSSGGFMETALNRHTYINEHGQRDLNLAFKRIGGSTVLGAGTGAVTFAVGDKIFKGLSAKAASAVEARTAAEATNSALSTRFLKYATSPSGKAMFSNTGMGFSFGVTGGFTGEAIHQIQERKFDPVNLVVRSFLQGTTDALGGASGYKIGRLYTPQPQVHPVFQESKGPSLMQELGSGANRVVSRLFGVGGEANSNAQFRANSKRGFGGDDFGQDPSSRKGRREQRERDQIREELEEYEGDEQLFGSGGRRPSKKEERAARRKAQQGEEELTAAERERTEREPAVEEGGEKRPVVEKVEEPAVQPVVDAAAQRAAARRSVEQKIAQLPEKLGEGAVVPKLETSLQSLVAVKKALEQAFGGPLPAEELAALKDMQSDLRAVLRAQVEQQMREQQAREETGEVRDQTSERRDEVTDSKDNNGDRRDEVTDRQDNNGDRTVAPAGSDKPVDPVRESIVTRLEAFILAHGEGKLPAAKSQLKMWQELKTLLQQANNGEPLPEAETTWLSKNWGELSKVVEDAKARAKAATQPQEIIGIPEEGTVQSGITAGRKETADLGVRTEGKEPELPGNKDTLYQDLVRKEQSGEEMSVIERATLKELRRLRGEAEAEGKEERTEERQDERREERTEERQKEEVEREDVVEMPDIDVSAEAPMLSLEGQIQAHSLLAQAYLAAQGKPEVRAQALDALKTMAAESPDLKPAMLLIAEKHPEIKTVVQEAFDGIGVTAAPEGDRYREGDAIWANKDFDVPVKVVKDLGVGPDGERYVMIEGSNTGVPLKEIVYPGETRAPKQVAFEGIASRRPEAELAKLIEQGEDLAHKAANGDQTAMDALKQFARDTVDARDPDNPVYDVQEGMLRLARQRPELRDAVYEAFKQSMPKEDILFYGERLAERVDAGEAGALEKLKAFGTENAHLSSEMTELAMRRTELADQIYEAFKHTLSIGDAAFFGGKFAVAAASGDAQAVARFNEFARQHNSTEMKEAMALFADARPDLKNLIFDAFNLLDAPTATLKVRTDMTGKEIVDLADRWSIPREQIIEAIKGTPEADGTVKIKISPETRAIEAAEKIMNAQKEAREAVARGEAAKPPEDPAPLLDAMRAAIRVRMALGESNADAVGSLRTNLERLGRMRGEPPVENLESLLARAAITDVPNLRLGVPKDFKPEEIDALSQQYAVPREKIEEALKQEADAQGRVRLDISPESRAMDLAERLLDMQKAARESGAAQDQAAMNQTAGELLETMAAAVKVRVARGATAEQAITAMKKNFEQLAELKGREQLEMLDPLLVEAAMPGETENVFNAMRYASEIMDGKTHVVEDLPGGPKRTERLDQKLLRSTFEEMLTVMEKAAERQANPIEALQDFFVNMRRRLDMLARLRGLDNADSMLPLLAELAVRPHQLESPGIDFGRSKDPEIAALNLIVKSARLPNEFVAQHGFRDGLRMWFDKYLETRGALYKWLDKHAGDPAYAPYIEQIRQNAQLSPLLSMLDAYPRLGAQSLPNSRYYPNYLRPSIPIDKIDLSGVKQEGPALLEEAPHRGVAAAVDKMYSGEGPKQLEGALDGSVMQNPRLLDAEAFGLWRAILQANLHHPHVPVAYRRLLSRPEVQRMSNDALQTFLSPNKAPARRNWTYEKDIPVARAQQLEEALGAYKTLEMKKLEQLEALQSFRAAREQAGGEPLSEEVLAALIQDGNIKKVLKDQKDLPDKPPDAKTLAERLKKLDELSRDDAFKTAREEAGELGRKLAEFFASDRPFLADVIYKIGDSAPNKTFYRQLLSALMENAANPADVKAALDSLSAINDVRQSFRPPKGDRPRQSTVEQVAKELDKVISVIDGMEAEVAATGSLKALDASALKRLSELTAQVPEAVKQRLFELRDQRPQQQAVTEAEENLSQLLYQLRQRAEALAAQRIQSLAEEARRAAQRTNPTDWQAVDDMINQVELNTVPRDENPRFGRAPGGRGGNFKPGGSPRGGGNRP
ncbi:MAG TPA: hypothetical protein V6D17_05210 [Candidatus Obscuribacterales bacterium]